MANLKVKGVSSFEGTTSPNKAASLAIFNKILRAISPKYIPEINFSYIFKDKIQMRYDLHMERLKESTLTIFHNYHTPISPMRTCSPGFKLSQSKAMSYSVVGRCADLKFPHSMFITYMYIQLKLNHYIIILSCFIKYNLTSDFLSFFKR